MKKIHVHVSRRDIPEVVFDKTLLDEFPYLLRTSSAFLLLILLLLLTFGIWFGLSGFCLHLACMYGVQ